jgi:gluconate 5-dehydrogenase
MAANPFDLTGRRALVTGASRGLGYAMAKALERAGAVVTITGRDKARLDDAVRRLHGEGYTVEAACFDVTDARASKAAVDALLPLDILINNAGINQRAPLHEFDPAAFRRIVDTHLTAAFRLAKLVAPGMIERGRGKIINICSITSEAARETAAPYAAAKGALKMLTKAMAGEWAKHGVQVNAIGPGFFKTDMNAPLIANPAFDGWVKSRIPAGRWGEPDELGGTAVFLASSASDFVNGQVLYVDGGHLATM